VQGTCGNLPDHEDETGLRGIALDNARLWSEPDVRTGVVVADVVAGTPLSIEDGPRMGHIRADTDDRGHFYYVQIDGQTTVGWVWSARLLIDNGDPTSDRQATTLDNARLWSQPDVTVGSITHSLDVGTVVIIQSDPQLGRIRTDTSDMGYWYLVIVEDTDTSGWIWAERLSADHTPSTTGTRATALDNARLWSQPDVSVGSDNVDLAAGTLVIVESGPQLGRIRVDTDDLGHWYFVRVEGTDTTGWIWSPRLRFH
jgi:hypothetical protein